MAKDAKIVKNFGILDNRDDILAIVQKCGEWPLFIRHNCGERKNTIGHRCTRVLIITIQSI